MAVYNTAFRQFSLGQAAALSIVLLIALIALNGIQFLFLRKGEDA